MLVFLKQQTKGRLKSGVDFDLGVLADFSTLIFRFSVANASVLSGL